MLEPLFKLNLSLQQPFYGDESTAIAALLFGKEPACSFFREVSSLKVKELLDFLNSSEEWVVKQISHFLEEDGTRRVNLLVFNKTEDIVVAFDTGNITVTLNILHKNFPVVSSDLQEAITSCNERVLTIFSPFMSYADFKDGIKVLIKQDDVLTFRSLSLSKKEVSLEDNYNLDLLPVHQDILKGLPDPSSSGIVLFHGLPGTGKTSYIHHLIQTSKNLSWVFCPVSIVQDLAGPELVPLLVRLQNPVLVIEDAEPLITHDGERKAETSTILNLGDGLLGSALNTKIVITMNVNVKSVDKALLRSGRMLASYKFDKLSAEQATKLSFKLGKNHQYSSPVLLSNVYNDTPKGVDSFDTSGKMGF